MRLFGVSASAVARLADAGGDGDGVEVTICARDFEIHVDLVVDPARSGADELEAAFLPSIEQWLYSREEQPIEAHVLALCRERGLTLGTAESCTGGLVAARLTGIPGSSEVFRGAVVAYGNEVKERELGVPTALIAELGAVSPGRRGDGEGRPHAARRRRRGVRDRDRRPGRRQRGEARRPRLPPRGGPAGGVGREFSFQATGRRSRARSVVGTPSRATARLGG
jgi:hypothetical protein